MPKDARKKGTRGNNGKRMTLNNNSRNPRKPRSLGINPNAVLETGTRRIRKTTEKGKSLANARAIAAAVAPIKAAAKIQAAKIRSEVDELMALFGNLGVKDTNIHHKLPPELHENEENL